MRSEMSRNSQGLSYLHAQNFGFSDFVRRSVSLILARDPVSGDEHFMGPSILADEFMDVSEALGIDTDRLMC